MPTPGPQSDPSANRPALQPTAGLRQPHRVGHLGVTAGGFASQPMPSMTPALPAPEWDPTARGPQATPSAAAAAAHEELPEVWLISLATAAGGMRPIEGAGRTGAVRVSRPFGHLRALRPVMPEIIVGATPEPEWSQVWTEAAQRAEATARAARKPGTESSSNLPAQRLVPQVVSTVEVETDAGIFRVERREDILTHSDLAWAIANLEPGEPDGVVPLPRRQLAMLLTLLPAPEDPEHPEADPTWGWAHRLRGPWERGPLHGAGKLGRLISVDPDPSGRGMHRACFEIVGTDEIVWAAGVPCFRAGSVYELVPLSRKGSMSRWLSWPLGKGRRRPDMPERPKWEIARAVYRVGAPRWPLAGVVEPLGPLGVAG